MAQEKKLMRSESDKMLLGVCSGLAKYFGIDAVVMRIIFVLGGIVTFPLVPVLYVVLYFIMPSDSPASA